MKRRGTLSFEVTPGDSESNLKSGERVERQG